MRRRIRLTESDLHRIVDRSVRQVLREGWFGNDKKYGEKWYNPFSWKSDSEKRNMDRRARAQEQMKQQAGEDKRREEREWNRRQSEEYRKEKKERDARLAKVQEPYYASHAGETYYGIGHSAYDDMGR